MRNYSLTQFFAYYMNENQVSEEEYIQEYLIPKLGIRRTRKCLELLKYQGFLACHPSMGKARIRCESSGREYFEILDFKIRVYFKTNGSVCEVYETEEF